MVLKLIKCLAHVRVLMRGGSVYGKGHWRRIFLYLIWARIITHLIIFKCCYFLVIEINRFIILYKARSGNYEPCDGSVFAAFDMAFFYLIGMIFHKSVIVVVANIVVVVVINLFHFQPLILRSYFAVNNFMHKTHKQTLHQTIGCD